MATLFSDYPGIHHRICSFRSSYIITVLQTKKIMVGATRLGFFPEGVGVDSLQCGGSMDMHISGVADRTLMAIGWWDFLGFMVYIQQHISSFSAGVTLHMSHQPCFCHIRVSSCLSRPTGPQSAHLMTPEPSVWPSDILFLTS